VKVLLASTSGLGHVNPMIPLAQAFKRRGDDVLWATAPDAHAVITAAGVRTVAAGLPQRARTAEYHERYPEGRELSYQEFPAHFFPRAFGEIAVPAMLDQLRGVADDWSPDMMLHEVGEFATPIVADARRIPHVAVGFGARLRPERLEAVGERVETYWRAAGLEPRSRAGAYEHLYLDIYPPCLDPGFGDDIAEVQPLRPAAIEEPATGDAVGWLEREVDRPLVYVTFGTVFNAPSQSFRAAVGAVVDFDGRALVTVGPGADTAAFDPLPVDVRVEQYVPQHVVLAHASIVVSHAGSGTFLATLSRGIPQICLPQAADQFANATAGANAGAAIQIAPQDATLEAVASALSALSSDDRYTDAARRVAAEIAAMPDADAVATMVADRFAPG
jgi:UDP:flavonoid glycosyltransferase YjiC (YdhE family)